MQGATALPNVARLNRALVTLWRNGALPRPVLETEALETAALRGSPVEALGFDQEWREPFAALVRSLGEEADLNPLGLAMAHGQIVAALRARMRAHALWSAYPEILTREVGAPIIILGQARSGTTRMQRLLACDERLAHTRLFESLNPVPPRFVKGLFDTRRIRATIGIALLRSLNPEQLRIHPVSVAAPEEDFGFFCFSFASAVFEAQWRVPSFSRWWEAADGSFLYREFKALLQTGGWFRGEPEAKPRILKAPQFMQDLPAVLGAFPDARLIFLERNIEQVVPSGASLIWNQMRVQSDSVDPEWIGDEWLRKIRLREQIAAQTLASRPDVRRITVAYEAMNRDWRGEIERVYDWLGLDLSPALVASMAKYVDNARDHLGHRYSLDQFGLSRAKVLRGQA